MAHHTNRPTTSELVALKNIQANGHPQHKRLVNHFLESGSLSQYEALLLYRIAALPRRISDLEEAGLVISKARRTDPSGRQYVRYWLKNFDEKVSDKTKGMVA